MEPNEVLSSVVKVVVFLLPIILPILLAKILFDMWVSYIRERFINNQETVLLKIVPPTEILKTPLAMEFFINGLHQTSGESKITDVYWKGSVRPWFSLELVSDGGKVNFYLWTRKGMAGYLESQIYSQYPGIEVMQVPDYATEFNFNETKHAIWATEYEFTEDNSIPIKTYVDYGLDKVIEDEEKTDPITPTLEFFGSIQEGEKIWIQIIARAHKKEDSKTDAWFGKTDLWVDNYKKEVKKIKEIHIDKNDKDASKNQPLSKVQESRIEAIERSQGKLPFDVGIRGIYIAEKDIFNPVNIGGLIGSFKQYSSTNLNGFKPVNKTSIDYWWQDPFNTKLKKMEQQMLEDYKDRTYFFKSFIGIKRKVLVMNSEELATMFHFPGSVAVTPGLERIQSRKSNAPSDLPI